MAAINVGGLFARFAFWGKPPKNAPKQSRVAYDFSRQVYNDTGGPTKDLKRVFRVYLDNQKVVSGMSDSRSGKKTPT